MSALLLGYASLELVVDWNATFIVQLNADRVQSKTLGVRTTTDAY